MGGIENDPPPLLAEEKRGSRPRVASLGQARQGLFQRRDLALGGEAAAQRAREGPKIGGPRSGSEILGGTRDP